jgi:hypothetical protein
MAEATMKTGAPMGPWPELPLEPWRGTRDTLHLVSQLLGKTLLATCAPQNHWWHAALRVTARGLASLAPVGDRGLDLELDLVEHAVVVRTPGRERRMPLVADRSMHAYLDGYRALLREVGVDVELWPVPVEVPAPVPFDGDDVPRPYDRAQAATFFQVLRRCDAALKALAGRFVGKQSPVHFFWGSFDLAATRFSGRRAPERPGADPVTREAYSHEVISFGFWPGGVSQTGVAVDEPIVYAYAVPEPDGFRDAAVPAPGRYDGRLGEFVLPYDAVARRPDPAAEIRAFCEAAYEAGATLGRWDRPALERDGAPAAASAHAHTDLHPVVH